ncbi:MAG TPA: lipocalin-like domain-containing protein [Hyphomicrobiales bacterium]|nr:lipocalin-like domain-containing protein [Hyphomicrobiales bacterium]
MKTGAMAEGMLTEGTMKDRAMQERTVRRTRGRLLSLLLLAVLGGCTEPSQQDTVLRLGDVLGGDDTAGYLRADAPRAFSFPADHGPHPGFRNEWWYLTGNLATADGRRFGYQLTFFNGALRAPGTPGQPSAWDSERVWMAHLAVSDNDTATHQALERFARENPGLAGADADHVWLEDWQVHFGDDETPWQVEAHDAATGLGVQLDLRALKPPVLQGRDGLSQKSAEPGNASYYYSLTRLDTTGSVNMNGNRYQVAGLSWLDREWSTSALTAEQSGWNWLSLQFDSGEELMYYELLDSQGAADANSAGNWTDAAGRQTAIAPADIALRPLRRWRSPAGVDYVTAWELDYAGRRLRVSALFDAQWMGLSLPYWEGAVAVYAADSGMLVGRGYLEMVRP